jgi:4-amino-4-deoxy-L-arabinose transferase-like glycosyltransferase
MSSAPRPSTPSRRDALFILAVAVLGAVVARVLRHVLLHDVAHVQDELAYVFQAQTLVTGHLTEPLLLPRAAFNMWFIEDRWSRFGIFPPGWPVLLAAGIRLHVVDWVNPALHALSVGMVARIARRIAGRRATLLATVLYAFSPQALFLAASLMSHTLVALCATVVLLYGIEQVKRSPPSVLRAIAAGLALGVVAGTRPLCMVCLSLFAAGCLVYASIAERRLPWADVVGLGLPLAVALALLFFYNASLTGSALVFPQNNYFNEHLPPADSVFFRYHHGCNNLGFGHGCDWSIVDANHTLETALDNTGSNLRSWLLLAGGGPLVFAATIRAGSARW